MRTTAILNLKGGVGKTTTVIHMANILHRDYGARVLLVDCDHQHNLTLFFGSDPEKGSTIEPKTANDIKTAYALSDAGLENPESFVKATFKVGT